jgi:uncharacterized protein (TIGR02596 family)
MRMRGFTLLEMLLVLVLTMILLALSFEGYSGFAQSTAISTSADLLRDAFTEARQDALAQNLSVEVRIYALPKPGTTALAYSALQLHWIKADGSTPPAHAVIFLPTSVVIDATKTHSTLIAVNTQTATPDATDSHLDKNTRVFHFLPDGSTDFAPPSSWFLTVRAVAQADPDHFPSNWACISIDPTTGRATIYRP